MKYTYDQLNLRTCEAPPKSNYEVPQLRATLGNMALSLEITAAMTSDEDLRFGALKSIYDSLQKILVKAEGKQYHNHRVFRELGRHANTMLLSECLETLEVPHVLFNYTDRSGIMVVTGQGDNEQLRVLTNRKDGNHGMNLAEALPRADTAWIIDTANNVGSMNMIVGTRGDKWVSPDTDPIEKLVDVNVLEAVRGRDFLEIAGHLDPSMARVARLQARGLPTGQAVRMLDIVAIPVRT